MTKLFELLDNCQTPDEMTIATLSALAIAPDQETEIVNQLCKYAYLQRRCAERNEKHLELCEAVLIQRL